jgi:DNA-binding transcriptional LysR family regulator
MTTKVMLLFGSIDEILDGRVDVAFTRLKPGQTELEVEVLTDAPRLVALARGHPLAARDSLRYAELSDESFVVNPAVPGDGAPRRWLEEQRRHGLPGRIAAESASIQEILALVASGRGVCLVPAAVARQFARPDVAYVPVSDAEPAIVSLAWRRGARSSLAGAFVDAAREVAAIR